jgi:hypothetical protein
MFCRLLRAVSRDRDTRLVTRRAAVVVCSVAVLRDWRSCSVGSNIDRLIEATAGRLPSSGDAG